MGRRHRYGAKIAEWSVRDMDYYTNFRQDIIAAFGADLSFPIRLDKKSGVFTAEIPLELPGAVLQNVSLEQLRKDIVSFLAKNAEPMQWYPFISVEMDRVKSFTYQTKNTPGYINLMVERFHYAIDSNGRLLTTKRWDSEKPEKHGWTNRGKMDFEHWTHENYKRNKVVLLYTELLWNNLMRIIDTIEEAKDRMDWLLKTDGGQELLSSSYNERLLLEE